MPSSAKAHEQIVDENSRGFLIDDICIYGAYHKVICHSKPKKPLESANRSKIEEPVRKMLISHFTGSYAAPKIFYGRFWRSLAKRVMSRYNAQLSMSFLEDARADYEKDTNQPNAGWNRNNL